MKTVILHPTGNAVWVQSSTGVGDVADRLEKWLAEVQGRFVNSISLSATRQSSLDELYEMVEACCSADWDGYGSAPVAFETYRNAEQFVHALPNGIPQPQVSIDPDGEISFEWYAAPTRVFSVSVGPDNELAYAGLFGASRTYGTEVFFDEVPDVVLQNIKRLTY